MSGVSGLQFGLVWGTAMCVLAILAVRSLLAAGPDWRTVRPGLTLGELVLVLAITLLLAAAVLPFAGWGYTDDDVFVNFFLRGRPYSPPIWYHIGRFFPLGLQEWRLLYRWATDVHVYHAFALVQFAIFGVAIAGVLRDTSTCRMLVLAAVITAAPALLVFANLVLPERMQLLSVAIWLWAAQRWMSTGSGAHFFVSLIAANTALYQKEPTFLFFGTFAVLGLLRPRADAASIDRISRSRRLDAALLVSSGIFVALYLVGTRTSVLTSGAAYGGLVFSVTNVPAALTAYLSKDPLTICLLALGWLVALWRWTRDGIDIWIRLLAGATMYFGIVLLARAISMYYLALPAVAAGLALWGMVASNAQAGRIALLVSGPVVLLNIAFATTSLLYRRDWIDRNVKTVDWLAGHLTSPGETLFVEGDRWDVCMFALYAGRVRGLSIAFEGPSLTPSCSPVTDTTRQASAPRGGQVVLDLGVLIGERRAAILRGGELLWTYQGAYATDIQPRLPPVLERVLRPHYNHW